MLPWKDSVRLTRLPLVTTALVVANVVVYLIATSAGGSLVGGPSVATLVSWGAIPYEWSHYGQHCAIGLGALGQVVLCTGQPDVAGTVGSQPATWLTAFSATFIAKNVLQLIVNTALLAVFGSTLEQAVGRTRFLGLYLLGALGALAIAILAEPGSALPLLGGAGALAAVLGGYLALHPRERVLSISLVPRFAALVEVPAWAWALAWVAFDALFGALGVFTTLGGAAGATYYAHYSALALGGLGAWGLVRRRSAEQAVA